MIMKKTFQLHKTYLKDNLSYRDQLSVRGYK